MKYLNKLASAFLFATLGVFALTSCEGGDLYTVNPPAWLSEMGGEEPEPEPVEELEGQMDDVYDIGNAELTSPFFTVGKKYVIPAGEKWQCQFNLTVNPDNKYYKNFFIVLNAYKTAEDVLGDEFGVIRFDNDPSKNSEWNTVGTEINRDLIDGNFTNSSGSDDIDASVQKMNGKITVTVDRTDGGLFIKMTNGTLTKTYTQTTSFPSTGSDVPIVCRIGIEGSQVNFLSTNIDPVEGRTEAGDKIPVSMVLNNVPDEVLVGTTLEEAMKDVTADVTFESLPTPQTIKAENLHFNAIPDMDNPGEKTLVVIFNKTFKGENAEKPIIANATFKVVKPIESIEVTKAPSNMKYYFYYNPDITGGLERTLPFDPTGMEVTATYVDGSKEVMNNSKLTFDSVPAEEGTYNVKITTANGKTTTVKGISVVESEVTEAKMTPSIVGNEDNSTGWWGAHADNKQVPVGATYKVNFTNYSPSTGNWNNFVIILRGMSNQPEYAVVRADNYGWASGYDGNAELVHGCNLPFDEKWLTSMNGAKCTAYITNSGNNRADIQVVAKGADDFIYTLYYLNIKTNQDDLGLSFTVDGSHIVFE